MPHLTGPSFTITITRIACRQIILSLSAIFPSLDDFGMPFYTATSCELPVHRLADHRSKVCELVSVASSHRKSTKVSTSSRNLRSKDSPGDLPTGQDVYEFYRWAHKKLSRAERREFHEFVDSYVASLRNGGEGFPPLDFVLAITHCLRAHLATLSDVLEPFFPECYSLEPSPTGAAVFHFWKKSSQLEPGLCWLPTMPLGKAWDCATNETISLDATGVRYQGSKQLEVLVRHIDLLNMPTR